MVQNHQKNKLKEGRDREWLIGHILANKRFFFGVIEFFLMKRRLRLKKYFLFNLVFCFLTDLMMF